MCYYKWESWVKWGRRRKSNVVALDISTAVLLLQMPTAIPAQQSSAQQYQLKCNVAVKQTSRCSKDDSRIQGLEQHRILPDIMRVCSGIPGCWKQLRLHWLFGSFKKKKKWFTEITEMNPGPHQGPLKSTQQRREQRSVGVSPPSLLDIYHTHLRTAGDHTHPPILSLCGRRGGVCRVSGLKPAGWKSPGSQDADCLGTACLFWPPWPPWPPLLPLSMHTHTHLRTAHFTLPLQQH